MATFPEVDASFFEAAPVTFSVSRELQASPSAVWAEIIDDGWTEWFPGMSSCRYSTDPPHHLGSMRTVVINRLRVDELVMQFDPEVAWSFTAVAANVPFVTRLAEGFVLDRLGNASTLLTYRAGLELPLLLKPIAGVLRRQMLSSWAEAMEQLDHHLA